jgi:hypothetical protein
MALEIGIQNMCMDTRGDIFLKAVTLWDASMALSSWEEGLVMCKRCLTPCKFHTKIRIDDE